MNHNQIIQLNSQIRDVIEFRSPYQDERQQGSIVPGIVGGAVGAAGVGAGASYLRGRFVPGPVRPGMGGFYDTVGKGMGAFRGDFNAARTATANFIRPQAAAIGGAAQQGAAAIGGAAQQGAAATRGYFAGAASRGWGAARGAAVRGWGAARGAAVRGYGATRDFIERSKPIYAKASKRAGGGLKGFYRGIRGVARSATRGRSRWIGLESGDQRIIQLNASLREVIYMD
jgi:hypothetical protein